MDYFQLCHSVMMLTVVSHSVLGFSEYQYALERDRLQAGEKILGRNTIELTPDEIVVDDYMTFLKWQEYEATKANFLPALPFEDVIDDIKSSPVYAVLKQLPKGGNLAVHMNHILSKKTILEKIFNSSMLEFLCVLVPPGAPFWKLSFYDEPPAGWVKVNSDLTAYSIEEIVKHVTFTNVLSDYAKSRPTDTARRAQELVPLLNAAGPTLVEFSNYTCDHLLNVFKEALEHNVQYIEARVSHQDMYYVEGPDQIKLDDGNHSKWYETVKDALTLTQNDFPEFIGYREIITGKRYLPVNVLKGELGRAIDLQNNNPDIVSGFDIVADEDHLHSLLYYLQAFDETFQQSLLPTFFQAAETNWPKDILTSFFQDDPVSALDNAYDALILGSKRIGHGLGFLKHPYLVQVIKQMNIAIEINPMAERAMGYVVDQRQHPAVTYIRCGVPLVIGGIGPATLGYDEFTIDWYEIFMSWGLNLADLKQLAINSLQYSAMTEDEKTSALEKWGQSWETFITEIKSEACSIDFTASTPVINRIYPADGSTVNSTNVRVFGRHFESAVCQDITCKFGSEETTGKYVYNHMITCPTPANQNPGTVEFSISLGGDFIDTNLDFIYE